MTRGFLAVLYKCPRCGARRASCTAICVACGGDWGDGPVELWRSVC